MATSPGSALLVRKDPPSHTLDTWTAERRSASACSNSAQTSARRDEGTDAKRSRTSSSVAPQRPGGRNPSSFKGGIVDHSESSNTGALTSRRAERGPDALSGPRRPSEGHRPLLRQRRPTRPQCSSPQKQGTRPRPS